MKNYTTLYFLALLLSGASCQDSFEYDPSPSKPNGKVDANIVDYLRTRPDAFSILSSAIDRAGLATDLSSSTLTLFAPDDVAFKAYLGTKTLEDIPVDELQRVLLYHTLDGRILSSDLSLGIVSYPSQLLGSSLNLNRNASFVVTVNANRVFVSNIEATNGIIHVIPRVLTP